MSKNVKKRNWACVVYPESAPIDWMDRLQQTGLQCAISPLHDKDTNPDNTPKKPHYHVIMAYSGPTSYNVVKALTDSLGQPIPQALEQIRGYYRYLTHMDNPEKCQYNESDIRTINGFNVADYVELTHTEVLRTKKRLQSLIRELGIYEYADLMDYLADNEMDLEYEVASNNTYFFDRYISSRRHAVGVVTEPQNQTDSEQQDYQYMEEDAEHGSCENSVIVNQIGTQNTRINQKHAENSVPEQLGNTGEHGIKYQKPCPFCGSIEAKKNGKTVAGERFRCKDCGKTYLRRYSG